MEASVHQHALVYNWPPGSWGELTVQELRRFYRVEREMAEDRERERREAQIHGPPMNE